MIDFEKLLRILHQHDVEFIIVGGLAATAHGAAYVTNDLDICYQRTTKNYSSLVNALKLYQPKLRLSNQEAVPFLFDERTLKNGLNFTLETSLGPVDLLGALPGIGTYADLAKNAERMQLFEYDCLVMSLDDLIRAKRVAGRTKDLLVLQELEAIREMQRKRRKS